MLLAVQVHKTRNSMFYNDETEETESNIKAFRWIGGSFFAVAVLSLRFHTAVLTTFRWDLWLVDAHVRDCGMQGLNYIAATEADEKTKKSVCKFAALHALCNFVLM